MPKSSEKELARKKKYYAEFADQIKEKRRARYQRQKFDGENNEQGTDTE